MLKQLAVTCAAAVLVLGWATGAQAQGVQPQHSEAAWRGDYFNNMNLAGPPVLVRDDPELSFAWGFGSPAPGVVNPDYFSVRWTRYLDVAPGKYRVTVAGDDGYRLRIDGKTVVDRWFPQGATPFGFEVDLTGGHHLVEVEYFEQTENAQFRATVDSAQPVDPPVGAYTGQYFGNANLAGAPVATRPDAGISFDWGAGSPLPGVVPADYFSVRWTGTVGGTPGMYTFTTVTDDGVRLWVNDHLLIDAWYGQAATPHKGTIYLPGPAALRMEYFEQVGNASAKLSWSPGGGSSGSGGACVAGTTYYTVKYGDTLYSIAQRYHTTVDCLKAINGLASDAIYAGQKLRLPATSGTGGVDGIVVDNGAPGYQQGGDPAGWNTSSAGYNGSRWALSRYQESPGYQWARWYPALTPGKYEVFAFIPSKNASTHRATYWVAHAGGFTSRVVDQYAYSNVWVSLGTYQFTGNGAEYASLNVITGEPEASTRVGFDAVKFVRR
jgi:LysM repeat protein